jgi:uncharacterized membrane protein
MLTTALTSNHTRQPIPEPAKPKRLESIDLLRGIVMIIMCLDHTRDYFHKEAFLYSPEDLNHTTLPLFFTRWITHYCAPVFVFLAGISAYLTGTKKKRKQLSLFLLTRGLWLIVAELFIVSLFRSFNPTYPYFNLQVIWAIGISMIILSVFIYANRIIILLTGIVLIAAHNLLDTVHFPGNGIGSVLWSLLHDPAQFVTGRYTLFVRYPLLPWIGIMMVGYFFGGLYAPGLSPKKRKSTLLTLGFGGIALFIILRAGNFYGDAAHWSVQKNIVFSIMSFLNVSKYPPSLLYILMTLSPACIFLAITERRLNTLAERIIVYGRVPMFYYLAHILLIHLVAIPGVVIAGYKVKDMVMMSTTINSLPQLKGYGFNLTIVYLVWIGIVVLLYPLCKWFGRYKKENLPRYKWLSYL